MPSEATAAVPAPAVLLDVAQRVEERLTRVLDGHRREWVALDPDLDGPLAEVQRFVLGGGKRLRAAFCWEGYRAGGADPDATAATGSEPSPSIVDVCSAFELMHAFALFHDDVMDGAATRRGAATTHVVYGDMHEEAGWAGDPRRFGDGMAILIGDLTFVFSDQLLAGANAEVWRLWNTLRVELNVGQVLDLLGSAQRDRRTDKAARICRYKSGKYTIERPLHVGAALGAPERINELAPHLSSYGLPLGDAFQLRDDVIGAFGDPAVTGKPVGDDLREGKPTPLLAAAVAAAGPAQRAVLERVGDPELDAGAIDEIQQTIVDTGALADVEQRIDALHADAVLSLETAPLAAGAQARLIELAAYVVQRRQ